MNDKYLVKEVKGPFRSEEKGIGYLTYRWKGHKITFLEEDVEVYEWYLWNVLESMIPVYVHQRHRGSDDYELTDKEVKDAVLRGMSDELFLYNVRIEEQAESWQTDSTFKYNEEVGIIFFREPQELMEKVYTSNL